LAFLLYKYPDVIAAMRPADHPGLEVAFWIAQTLVAVLAIFALGYAAVQIDEAGGLRRASLLQARGTFLLQLDERWDSPEMSHSWLAFHKLRTEAITEVSQGGGNLSDTAKVQRAAALFPEKLRNLRTNKPEEYAKLITVLLGFCETVGVMVKKEYVLAEDVYDLLAGPILDIGIYCKAHIKERQDEMGVLKGLFEHALYLIDRMEEIRAIRSVGIPSWTAPG
jgi:hypothetical protein